MNYQPKDEFEGMDIDLRNFLDELVNVSLVSIKTMEWRKRAFRNPASTDQLRTEIRQQFVECQQQLEEVKHLFESTLGYH